MAIDMHCHWTPRGLIQRSAAGRDWYGWKILKDEKGREHIAQGERILQFAASTAALDDPARRAQVRKEREGIDLQSLLLTGTPPIDSETLRQAGLDEIRRLIRETDPPKPSTRLQSSGEKLKKVAGHKPPPEKPTATPPEKRKRLRPSFRRELEDARQIIAHLTAENASSWKKLDQAWRTLKEVEEQLAEVKKQLEAEEREGHQAEEIILAIERHWSGKPAGENRLPVM